MRYNQLMILNASIYHLLWGFCLLIFGGPIPFTASVILAAIIPGNSARALTLIGAAILACIGMLLPVRLWLVRLLCLLPQQFLLMLGAFAVAQSVVVSHFGDGVIRPRQFIFLDQLPMFLLFAFYTVSLLEPPMQVLVLNWRARYALSEYASD